MLVTSDVCVGVRDPQEGRPGQRFVFVLSSPTLWSCRCMWLCKLLIAAPKCNEPPCKVLLFLVVVAPAVRNTVTVVWSQLQLPRRPISFLLWERVSEPCSRLKNHLTSAEQEFWFQIEKLRLMSQRSLPGCVASYRLLRHSAPQFVEFVKYILGSHVVGRNPTQETAELLSNTAAVLSSTPFEHILEE